MGWIDNFSLSDLNLNTSLIENNTEQIQDTLIENTKDKVGSSWGIFTTLVLFVVAFFYWANKYNLIKTLNISSFVSFIITILITILSFTTSLYPLFLFGLLFILSSICAYNLKERNKLTN